MEINKIVVACVVVTYNPSSVEFETIHSLIKSKHQFKVILIVIDNSDLIDSRLRIREIVDSLAVPIDERNAFNYVKYIQNEHNIGLSRAYNIGIKLAQSFGSDIILFFDQDSKFNDEFIQTMINDYMRLSARNFNFILSPTVILKKTRIQSSYLTLKRMFLMLIGHLYEDQDIAEELFAINSGVLIPLKLLLSSLIYDETLFVDAIDISICQQARRKNIHIYRSKRAILTHSFSTSLISLGGLTLPIGIHNDQRLYHMVKDYLNLFKKQFAYFPIETLEQLFYRIITVTGSILISKNKHKTIVAILKAFSEFLTQNS